MSEQDESVPPLVERAEDSPVQQRVDADIPSFNLPTTLSPEATGQTLQGTGMPVLVFPMLSVQKYGGRQEFRLFTPQVEREIHERHPLPPDERDEIRGQIGFIAPDEYKTRADVWDEADRRLEASELLQMAYKLDTGLSFDEEAGIRAMRSRQDRKMQAGPYAQVRPGCQSRWAQYTPSRPRRAVQSRSMSRHNEWAYEHLSTPLPAIPCEGYRIR